jgi:hypothetical protein
MFYMPRSTIHLLSNYSGWGVVGVKLIDNALLIVLNNGEQEIDRDLAPSADALRGAVMMVTRRGGWRSATCSR